MALHETYPHAPITEAVLDIRVRLPLDVPSESLEKLHGDVKDLYPVVRQPFRVNFKVERKIDSEPITEASHSQNGFSFFSADGRQIFQARPDGFSHNRLAPYIDWSSFQSEARRLWTKYRSFARPAAIELLGLNFANRIILPVGENIDHYFRTYIEVPAELPQKIEAHNLFVQMEDPESKATIGVSVNLGPAGEPDKVAATLNVQAFKLISGVTSDLSEDSIWATFERLRELKNLAFESSITDKTREQFR